MFLAARLPDATVGITPVLTDVLGHDAHQVPERTLQLLAIAFKAALTTIEMNGVQHLAEDIELLLMGRPVADAHRTRIAIAAQVWEFLLNQIPFATNAIHDLQVLAIREREALEPVGKGVSLFRKAQHAQSVQGKTGIA